jgi:SAM-dependent methyltransferase
MRTAEMLTEQLRNSGVDLCDVLLTPERFPEWSSVADAIPVEDLLLADPDIGTRNAPRVLRTGQIRGDQPLGELHAERRIWLAEMVLYWRRQFIEVSQQISPQDGFYQKSRAEWYFAVGHTAVRHVGIAMLEARVGQLTSILDFGCGFGRVLRTLHAAFPEAKLTACDINRDGVDFCAETFGATPVYSAVESKDIALEGPFDLIWAGSVFSHLSAPRWSDFLSFFESLLGPKGLLVFTTMGRRVAAGLRRNEFRWPMDEQMIEALLEGYGGEGYGYRDYPDVTWGLALVKPSWVCAELDKHAELRLLTFTEGGWGYQDVVSCMRADEHELARTGA